eukprot:Lithocolla_globosa_v1_NODE_586_length_3676_cov_4.989506.p1 type:complete len:526 gc:universal NODE_586_length_3676_cov_4.989506:2205-628(-)
MYSSLGHTHQSAPEYPSLWSSKTLPSHCPYYVMSVEYYEEWLLAGEPITPSEILDFENGISSIVKTKPHLPDTEPQEKEKGYFKQQDNTDDDDPPSLLDSDSDSDEDDFDNLIASAGLNRAQQQTTKKVDDDGVHLVLVDIEDYKQDTSMPSYKGNRPNIDFFTSDLHERHFIACDCTTGINHVYVYDERTAGKGGNETNSLRWYHYTRLIQQYINEGKQPPRFLLRVCDNCSGQGKSRKTSKFDALLPLLLFDRVGVLFLIPGHSHMKADRVAAWINRSIKNLNIYLPSDLITQYNGVKSVRAEFIETDHNRFRQWDEFLNKHFKALPTGFSSKYCFEYHHGAVTYKRTVLTPDDDAEIHVFCQNPVLTRKVVLDELLGLAEDASLEQIVSAPLKLPISDALTLTSTKLKSLAKKYSAIPREARHFYPDFTMEELIDSDYGSDSDDERLNKKRKLTNDKQVQTSLAKGSTHTPNEKASKSQPSIVNFLLLKPKGKHLGKSVKLRFFSTSRKQYKNKQCKPNCSS